MKQTKFNLIIILVVSIYLVFVKLTNIRICLIYNLFHIPCPACGLTRAYNCLLNGDVRQSLQYNIIAIPIAISFILYVIFSLKDDLKNTKNVEVFLNKYKVIIICLSSILVISSWSFNLIKAYMS